MSSGYSIHIYLVSERHPLTVLENLCTSNIYIFAPWQYSPSSRRESKLLIQFSRYGSGGFGLNVRNASLLPVNAAQVEDLNAVHSAARKNAIELLNRKGGILFMSNMALLHAQNGKTAKIMQN